MSAASGKPVQAAEYTTMGHCPHCRAYVRGRHLRTVDERHALVEHDDCPVQRPKARSRRHAG
ncbi:hypothetical protein [Kitasatospora sp. NPDC056181]|uniref:hypothetical protein n=1 Tax=Kitasatospora sp. NPDC056181 TaxID=3345737 RepID=UPI0035DD1016